MPAIKGDTYINTHCNYSQPTLIKLYNENIGGHLTPLQRAPGDDVKPSLGTWRECHPTFQLTKH